MDDVQRGNTYVRKTIKYQNIPLTSFLDHLNCRIRCRKVGPQGGLTKQEDEIMVTWVLNMQKVRLSINLQQ